MTQQRKNLLSMAGSSAAGTTLTVLQNSPLFRDVDTALLREIATLSTQRRYANGEVIFAQNEPGNYLYGVISGSVRVATRAADGRELALNTMMPGDIIGEIAVLDGGTRTASGHALEDTVVFVIAREPFTALMLREPTIALHMIKLLCQRVRRSSRQVEEAAFLTLPQRLALLLESLLDESSAAADGDSANVIKISQSELASFLNVTRQAVNGCLQTWQKEGFIALKRGRIEILDLQSLLGVALAG